MPNEVSTNEDLNIEVTLARPDDIALPSGRQSQDYSGRVTIKNKRDLRLDTVKCTVTLNDSLEGYKAVLIAGDQVVDAIVFSLQPLPMRDAHASVDFMFRIDRDGEPPQTQRNPVMTINIAPQYEVRYDNPALTSTIHEKFSSKTNFPGSVSNSWKKDKEKTDPVIHISNWHYANSDDPLHGGGSVSSKFKVKNITENVPISSCTMQIEADISLQTYNVYLENNNKLNTYLLGAVQPGEKISKTSYWFHVVPPTEGAQDGDTGSITIKLTPSYTVQYPNDNSIFNYVINVT